MDKAQVLWRTHYKVISVTPLAAGWRIVTPTYVDTMKVIEPEVSPVAALAYVDEWTCRDWNCLDPETCREQGLDADRHKAWYPVWAKGFNVLGDAFDLDTDNSILGLLGPGEEFSPDRYLTECRELTAKWQTKSAAGS